MKEQEKENHQPHWSKGFASQLLQKALIALVIENKGVIIEAILSVVQYWF
ncbi:hypothetical protein [Flavobacterium lindanitolerans]|nr:hypothetical protein [Flavobacterium lindanitolerans]MBC8643727.1 hypothetical protein [Flavobacterium lindanitolerans]